MGTYPDRCEMQAEDIFQKYVKASNKKHSFTFKKFMRLKRKNGASLSLIQKHLDRKTGQCFPRGAVFFRLYG